MCNQHIQQGSKSHRVQGFDDNLVEEGILGNRWNTVQLIGPGFPVFIAFFRIGWFLSGVIIILHRMQIVNQMIYSHFEKKLTDTSEMNL